MVLRVRPAPTGFPIDILSTPVDSTALHSISSVGGDSVHMALKGMVSEEWVCRSLVSSIQAFIRRWINYGVLRWCM